MLIFSHVPFTGKFFHTTSTLGEYVRDELWRRTMTPGGEGYKHMLSEIMDFSPVKYDEVKHLL